MGKGVEGVGGGMGWQPGRGWGWSRAGLPTLCPAGSQPVPQPPSRGSVLQKVAWHKDQSGDQSHAVLWGLQPLIWIMGQI